MKKNLYSIYDSKANYFGNPFTSVNHATAIRTFSQACEDPNSELNRHSIDFSLFFIGTYDDEVGVVHSENHINLGLASAFSGRIKDYTSEPRPFVSNTEYPDLPINDVNNYDSEFVNK